MDTELLPAFGYCEIVLLWTWGTNMSLKLCFLILCVSPEVELVGHTVTPLSLFSNHCALFHSTDTILHSCGGSFTANWRLTLKMISEAEMWGNPQHSGEGRRGCSPNCGQEGRLFTGWGGRGQGADQGRGLCTSVGECDSRLRMGPTDGFEQRSDLTTLPPASFTGRLRVRGTVAEYSGGGRPRRRFLIAGAIEWE